MLAKLSFAALLLLAGVSAAKAELPPYVYEEMQKNSSEQLTIETLEVKSSLSGINEKSYSITAKVTGIAKSKSRLHKGDTITIEYTRVIAHPPGWVGPSPIPVLEQGQSYKAYLHRDEDGKYRPSARGRSFI